MLSVIRHRQLARQVEAFGEFVIESSMDPKIITIFPAGSTFVFGSWVSTMDDSGKLQGRLEEISADQAAPAICQGPLEDLVQKIGEFFLFPILLGLQIIPSSSSLTWTRPSSLSRLPSHQTTMVPA